jgi:hypothetical protein
MLISSIDNVVKFDRQLNNLWELNIFSKPDVNKDFFYESQMFSLLCKGVDLPFIQLDIDNMPFGKKFYGKVTQENSFSIEVSVLDDFGSFNYFDNWIKAVYNVEGGYFYSFTDQKEYETKAERTFMLKYQKPVSVPYLKVAPGKFAEPYPVPPLTYGAIAKTASTEDFEKFNASLTAGSQAAKIAARSAIAPLQAVSFTGSYISQLTTSIQFKLNNVKITKIGNIASDYEKGDGMSLKVDFVFDSITKVVVPSL